MTFYLFIYFIATFNTLISNLDELEKELETNDIINLSFFHMDLDMSAESENLKKATSTLMEEKESLITSAKLASNQLK